MTEWRVCLLEKTFQTNSFDCGVPQLDDYLKKYAWQNQKRGVATTYVATSGEDKEVVGYYSASTGQINFESVPDVFKKGLPRYPIPIIRIGKLGVTLKAQNKGLGKELLTHALCKAVKLSQEIGIFAVTVDAIDEKAKQFYIKRGFKTFQDNDMSLFIVIQKIAEAFA